MNIAVLLSGGVDSSVALKLLQAQGHTVTAFYLKIWLEDELSFLGDCPWEEDLSFVKKVCQQNDVKLEIVSLQEEYKERIISYTLAEVQAGRTPNPDVLCNSRVKFGAFYDLIGNSFERVATGHYADLKRTDNLVYLKTTPDLIKDQTYFLSHLTQTQLQKAEFPIGKYHKQQVRELAEKYNLANKTRKDSQGLCFLGKIKYSEFIKAHLGENPGLIVDVDTQKAVGQHKGLWFHTIGQRQGLGLSGGPWYVVAKDINKNILLISRNYHENKQRDRLIATSCNWISGQIPDFSQDIQVKLRHGAQRIAATCISQADGSVDVKLASQDQGIAPGQFVVFYQNDYCLGSGRITLPN
jgi:tRNA (5-methylaminomethyl-2-thiouridylate)-methyltransferase